MSEQWIDIAGFEGRYQVSNLGRVKSLPNSRRNSELILKANKHVRTDHRYVGLVSNDGSGWSQKNYWIHRLVLEAFVGACPEGMEGCHNDGNPSNNELGNLRWDTDKGNQADRAKHGTGVIGESNPNARLTKTQVIEVKRRIKLGESDDDISTRFPISKHGVKHIRNGNSWRTV